MADNRAFSEPLDYVIDLAQRRNQREALRRRDDARNHEPPEDREHGEIHRVALERFENAMLAEQENRILAEEDFIFLAGDGQWPYEIRQQRQRDNRPCLTNNRLPQFVAQVVGDARQNRPSIDVLPAEDADEDTAEVLAGLIRNIESQCSAQEVYLSAFEHACGGGFGHWRIVTDWAGPHTFDQEIKIKRIRDPLSVFWDPNATDYSKQDAMWCFVSEWITREEFSRRFPRHAPRDWETPYVKREFGAWLDSDDRVRIAEYWLKEPVTTWLVLTDAGLASSEKPVEVGDMVSGTGPDGQPMFMQARRVRKVVDHKVVRYVLSGNRVLQGPQDWPGRHIPIVSVFGPEEFIDGRVRYRSIIRHAKDAMRMANFWETAITEKIALSPKPRWVGTKKQFEGLEHVWADANNSPDPYLPYNPDPAAPGPPQRMTAAPVEMAEIQALAQSIDDLKACTGIYDASLGAQGNETSGRAILARQREGDTATFAWIDNLARSIEQTGRILLDLIPHIYDTPRAIRILGEDGASKQVIVNQIVESENDPSYMLGVGKYDVVVRVGPSYATKRLEAADSMVQMAGQVPMIGQVAPDLMVEAMDWPGAKEIAARIKRALPPGLTDEEPQAPPPPDPAEQLRLQNDQQTLQNKQLDAMLKQQKIAEGQSELERIVEERVHRRLMEIMSAQLQPTR